MRATHSLIALSTLIFTLNANAGLFDSTPDFKCGREDAVSATQSKIRNDAVSKIQQAYLATPSRFYGKPLNDYIAKVNQISLVLENVTTKPYKNDEMTRDCTARVSLAVPADIMNYVASSPDKLTGLTNGGGKVLNNSVQWDNFAYSLSLADNGKDISVSYEYANRDYISESMAGVTVLALNKSELEKAELTNKLNIASEAYYESDRRLNALWKYLPDSVKAAMKKEQNVWINEKAKACGKITDASSMTTPLETRTSIYTCQTKMTDDRFHYLGGDDEAGY
ncbi:lysozyme inhibitor LprI family protein [Enterobacter kobei]